MTLASQMLGVPLTHVVRSLPEQAPIHFGLGCGITRLGLPYGRIPPLSPSKKNQKKALEKRNMLVCEEPVEARESLDQSP